MVSTAANNSRWHKHVHNFDIDNYLNWLVPRPRIYRLPRPISHFLGYRSPHAKPQSPPSNPVIWLSAFIGGFVGIAIISAVYHALPLLGGQQVPIVIASFGAAAILEYNTIESPLSQPRNLIVGHLLSALIGVAITKGFQHLPPDRFDEFRWVAGALSVGLASFVMGATKTVHPPAGATALLAATSHEITALGWWLLLLVLLASVLMSASALVINNITRRWPIYWWTPADLSKKPAHNDIQHVKDVEKQSPPKSLSVSSGSTSDSTVKTVKHIEGDQIMPDPDQSLSMQYFEKQGYASPQESRIVITSDKIVIPDWMEANDWECEVLEIFRQKLQQQAQS